MAVVQVMCVCERYVTFFFTPIRKIMHSENRSFLILHRQILIRDALT